MFKKHAWNIVLMFLCSWNTSLWAQRPTFATRLFSPVDTSVASFSSSQQGIQPILLSDSSLLTIGNVGAFRTFSRLDKQGSLLWTRTYRNDSMVTIGLAALPTGEMFLLGRYLPLSLDTFNRLFVTKLNVNGTTSWTTGFNVPQPAGLTGTASVVSDIAVSPTGAILVAGFSGTPVAWKSHCVLMNANGAVQRAWTYDTLQRPLVYPNLDGGFILALGKMVSAAPTSLVQTWRVSWLNAQGEEYRQWDLGHTVNATIGSALFRAVPIGDADSSLAIVQSGTVLRVTKTGQLIWAKNRSYQATPGLVFSGSSFFNPSLSVWNQNKLLIASTLFESTLGIGRELPIINEYDVATGALRARVLGATMNGRACSVTPFLNGAGFWIATDTVIALGLNQTRLVASRWIRADTSLNGGCGVPLLVNSTTFDAALRVLPQTPSFNRIPFVVNARNLTPLVAPTEMMIVRKGECPESIVATDDLDAAQVKVFPNPSAADFNVEVFHATIQRIRVFDAMGRLVQQMELDASQVSIPSLQAGTYFLHIQTNKGLVVKKVVQF